MMAGGCIWAKQDSDLANRVLKGLRAIRQTKGSYPITFVVLSRADAATRYQGLTGSTAAGAVKFDYKCHHDEMSEPGLVWPPGLQASNFATQRYATEVSGLQIDWPTKSWTK